MGSPFKPLCMVGVFGVVGIVGALGALGLLGPMRRAESFWFRPLPQRQAIADGQPAFTDRQVTSDPEHAISATGSVLSLGEEGPTITTPTEEIERLKASLEELGQLLQEKSTLESEVSRLHHLLEEKTAALSGMEGAETSTGKIHEFKTKITIQTEEIKRLKANLEKQDQLLQDKTAKLSSVEYAAEQRNAEKDEKIARLESEVADLNHILEERTTALSNAEEAATKREQLIQDLSDTNQRQHEEIRQMKRARRPSTDSEQISMPLPPTIVNKADTISVAEVAELVMILNAQIEQASSLIMDSLFDQESPGTGKELDIAWDELNDYIGSWLCNDLKRRSKELIAEPDPLIMQITLQTGLVNACSRIINDWNPPFWIDGLVFSRTYSSIEKANGQATADAWKTLSRTHMIVLQSERQEANKRYLIEVLLRLITAIGGSLESGGILLSQYKEKVEDIVQKAVGLHKTVSEDVTSMELATYTSPSDAPFDASQMEDTEGNESESRSSRVVCTVEMGLRCRKRDESGKKNGSREEWGVTMKSKVVLAATLEA